MSLKMQGLPLAEGIYRDSALPSNDALDITRSQWNQTVLARFSELREGLSGWKWTLFHFILFFGAAISGYDVSNVSTLQISIYEEFSQMNLLPWVVTSFSLGVSATSPTVDQIMHLVDLKWFTLTCWTLFIAATAVCGASPNMQAIIIGRVILGVAAGGCYLSLLSYSSLLARPAEHARLISMLGMGYAVGLFIGPVIGSALADSKNATWRWAFYICIPYSAIIVVLISLVCPRVRLRRQESVVKGLLLIDWVGGFLHASTIVLFDVACIFSGSTLAWRSNAIAIWALTGIVAVTYAIQQYFSIFTDPDRRNLPLGALSNRTGILVTCCTLSACCGYAVPLNYLPLYYSFARGDNSIQTAIHMLPYIGVYIVGAFSSAIFLPKVRHYAVIYLSGGILMTAGAASMVQLNADTPVSQTMGISTLIGFAVGFTSQLGATILAILLPQNVRIQGSIVMTLDLYTGTTVSLAVAGCIFQNIGFKFLFEALEGANLSNAEIHNALAGMESPVWASLSPIALDHAVLAVTKAIIQLFYISMAGGVLMVIFALCMEWEPLQFKPTRKMETEGRLVGNA